MIRKLSEGFGLFMLVLAPWAALLGYTLAIYPDLPEELAHGLPRWLILLPAALSAALVGTYFLMVFFARRYLSLKHYLAIAAFMDLGIVGLVIAVYLVKANA